MARFLTILHNRNNPSASLQIPTALFFVLMAIFSVLSVTIFLCASHLKARRSEEATENSSGRKLLCKISSNIGSKVDSMKKMISWRKVGAEEDDEEMEDSDEAVWRKRIMMGERCRPLDFSGAISYDSDGNLLPDSTCSKK